MMAHRKTKDELSKRLERAEELARFGNWSFNVADGAVFWSEGLWRIFGRDPEPKLNYEEFTQWIREDYRAYHHEVMAKMLELKPNESIDDFIYCLVRPNGEERWVEIFMQSEFDRDLKPRYFFGVAIDITEQIVAQNKMEHAKLEAELANQAKSEFLSSMSHELRTPLNAILGFSQLLELDAANPLSSDQIESVKHIKKSGTHLLELINQVLDLAKIESGKVSFSIEEMDPVGAIAECSKMAKNMADKRGVVFNDNTANLKLPYILADRTRFVQVLLNLLSNGIKYNRAGGTVDLDYEITPDEFLRLMVKDTGHGIANEYLDSVFKPFQRLSKEGGEIEGTGIGLTITKKLVRGMGGNIGFETEDGVGSTFWFEFPTFAISAQDGKAEEVLEDLTVALEINELEKSHTVLYVEDNSANLALMVKILDQIPRVDLISAHNAEVGLELAEIEKPSLILMDINLPGMDGIEALRNLQENAETSHIPVVAISAAAMPKDIKRGMDAGFIEYLTKPIQVQEVQRVVADILFAPS